MERQYNERPLTSRCGLASSSQASRFVIGAFAMRVGYLGLLALGGRRGDVVVFDRFGPVAR